MGGPLQEGAGGAADCKPFTVRDFPYNNLGIKENARASRPRIPNPQPFWRSGSGGSGWRLFGGPCKSAGEKWRIGRVVRGLIVSGRTSQR
jgi:hypothetical protein